MSTVAKSLEQLLLQGKVFEFQAALKSATPEELQAKTEVRCILHAFLISSRL
jgi:hypothetical protein